MNEFVLAFEGSIKEMPKIIQTKYPYLVGKIVAMYGDAVAFDSEKTTKIKDFNAIVTISGALSSASVDDAYVKEVISRMAEFARQTICVERSSSLFRGSMENREMIKGENRARRDERKRLDFEHKAELKREALFGKK